MSRSKTLTDQKIYLLCNGTSTNKVIDSINDNIKEKTSFFSTFFSKKTNQNNIKKINYEEFPRLENIGIKECHNCKENGKNSIIFKNELSNKNGSGYNPVFTSLDYNSIESAMILFSDIPNLVIFPLPYMSDKTNIKNKESFDIFKKKFGEYSLNSKDEVSSLKEYWNPKELNTEFINIKSKDQIVDWVYTSNINKSSLSSYNLLLFKKKFEDLLVNKYVTVDDLNNPISNNIFVCNDKIIVDMLRLFKSVRFNKKKNNIEVTSIWELSIDIEFKINATNKIIDKKIIYNNYNKTYPTEFNHGILIKNRNSEKYLYYYDNSEYLLFNSNDKISLKYLKNMSFRSYNDDKKSIIQKIIEQNKKNNKDKKNNKEAKNAKNTKNEKNKKTNVIKYENFK